MGHGWGKLTQFLVEDEYLVLVIFSHPGSVHPVNSGMDRQTFPTKIIHDSQRPKTPPVKQIIRHKIHTPALINLRQDRTLPAVCRTDMPAGTFPAQIQAFQTINPVCFLIVNYPAFPSQQDVNARTAVAYSCFRNFPDAQGYCPIITPTLPVVDSPALHQQPASPTDADTICLPQEMHRLALLSRPQNFCFSTSCSISLSRLRSATSFFSR